MKACLPKVLGFTFLFSAGTAVSGAAFTAIPLVQGLTLLGAASERQGDYESAPRDTNATLARRARNRRVELTRQ